MFFFFFFSSRRASLIDLSYQTIGIRTREKWFGVARAYCAICFFPIIPNVISANDKKHSTDHVATRLHTKRFEKFLLHSTKFVASKLYAIVTKAHVSTCVLQRVLTLGHPMFPPH